VSLPSPEPIGQAVQERPPYSPSPSLAPYHPPPAYPPSPAGRSAPTDGRAITSLVASIIGILLALPLGLPGLALGPLAYFLGRSAITRIDATDATWSGRSMAVAGSVLGAVATAIGAVVTLAWMVLVLVASSTPPTLG
jgi:hypothetical protein